MSALRSERRPVEPHVAAIVTALLGAGSVLALRGTVDMDLRWLIAGGALAAAALVALAATEWIDGFALIILALPLPALVSSGSLRIATVAPLTAMLVFAWLLARGVADRPLETGNLPVRSGGALLLAFVVATAFATHPATSARELVNIAVLVLFLVFAVDRFASDRGTLHAALTLLTAVAGLTGALALLEMVGILPGAFPRAGTSFNRAALGFGQPNGLGLFLAVCVPIVVHMARAGEAGARTLGRCALPFVLLGLVGTFSRGAWLAVLAGTGILVFAGGARLTVRIWLVALLFIVFTDLVTGGALRDTAQRTIGDWVIEQRLALQLAGLFMFIDHPFTGVGPGGYADNLDAYGAQIFQLTDYLPTPHNAYIQFAAETGVIGLAAYLVFLAAALRAGIRAVRAAPDAHETSLRQALLWSVATVAFAGVVVWPFAHGTGQAVLLVLAAALAGGTEPGAA